MSKHFVFWFNAVLVLSMLIVPFAGAQRIAAAPGTPQEVPAEVQAMFANGMSIDEFVKLNGGEVPHALADFVSTPTAVIIELEQAPVLAKAQAGNMPQAEQISYMKQLERVQAALEPKLVSKGATVMGRYTMVYNGFLAQVPSNQLAAISALPYVKAIHRAPEHVVDLKSSVPLIGAPSVWHDLGFDGTGINVAVVDTGIDYTHVVFGGTGGYATNDPTTVETGTFPTAKVVGGYDFAGTNYDAGGDAITQTVPAPDPDPLDEGGHGTHVASTIAGIAAGQVMTGVAPMAKLYALKVFGKEGSTNLVVNALEWIAQHNISATTEADKIHVVNMSLGASYGPNDPSDPEMVAVQNLSEQGVVLAISAGNSGDVPYIVGSPSVADSALSVAASTTGYGTGPTISISGTEAVTLTDILYNVPAFDDNTGHFTQTVTAPLYYVGKLGISDEFCDTSAVSTTTELQGKVALIQRGSCPFTQKVNNAAALGAVGAIIFNDEARGDALLTMAGGPVQIPAGFIGHTDGANLATAHGQTVVVSKESDIKTVESRIPADTIADFSSRGPRGYDSKLKPEITAPGVAIFAAKMGSGTEGVSMSGTSMAAPHMAGVAALVKQAHPTWTVEQIKAALMNTAKCVGVAIPRGGAGRVQADKAVATKAVAVGDEDLVSLSYGVVTSDQAQVVLTKTVRLYSWYTASHAYTVSAMLQTGSITEGMSITDGVTIAVPPTVEVPANGNVTVPVTMTVDMTKMPVDAPNLEEVYGFVVFKDTEDNTLRVPFYMVPRPYTKLNVTSTNTTITNWTSDAATVALQESGVISTYLEAHTMLITDTNEISQTDMGDVKYVAMDYGWSSGYGDVADVIIATYGSHHTPQPYFGEMDLYLDTDGDGETDYIDFNWNYGRYGHGGDSDTWIVAQFDLATGALSLASPYLIYTDYNAGYMEWFLPSNWNAESFTYQVVGYDFSGHADPTAPGFFDIKATPPFASQVDNDSPGPANKVVNIATKVSSVVSYSQIKPKGLMVIDYGGQPGKEASFVPVNVSSGQIAISKSVTPKSVDPGANVPVFTYTIKLTNQITTTTAYSVYLKDTLPPQLTFDKWIVSPTSGANVDDGVLTWHGDIAGGSVETFTFTMKPITATFTIAEPIANTATFYSIDGYGSATAIVKINHYIYMPLIVRNYAP